MEYYLNRLNVILLALVGGLCVWQWSGESKADRQIEDLRKAVAAAERHVGAQDEAIRGANEDLDEFKKTVTALKGKSDADDRQVRLLKARTFTLEQADQQHTADAGAWGKALAAYKEAVAARDGNIHLLLDQRTQLLENGQAATAKANQAVGAYNELAAKYAALVSQYNDLAKRYQALASPPPSGAPPAAKS